MLNMGSGSGYVALWVWYRWWACQSRSTKDKPVSGREFSMVVIPQTMQNPILEQLQDISAKRVLEYLLCNVTNTHST